MAQKKIGYPLPAPNKTRPSDLLAIPLGDGWFGYARVLNGAYLEILDAVSRELQTVDDIRQHKRRFCVQYYEPYSISPWIYLGKKPFDHDDERWGPPTWFGDTRFHILDRGVTKQVEKSETIGLQKCELSHPDTIVDLIIAEFRLDIPPSRRSRLASGQPS